MPMTENRLRWDGTPGHYEAYYVTFTDPLSGCGAWLRFSMLAPRAPGVPATCALWFAAFDPKDPAARVAHRETFEIANLHSEADPFELRIGDATLSSAGTRGSFGDVFWDLSWSPSKRERTHVDARLERARLAQTILRLPGPDLVLSGTIGWGGRELAVSAARGGQAHLWGTKHARRWCWMHASDLSTRAGEARPGSWIDAVSVFVQRLGRDVGPSTPVIGELGGSEFDASGPLAVLSAKSSLALTGWSFATHAGTRKLLVQVDAPREQLVGVTYHDPDDEPVYCYHSDVASVRAQLLEREGRLGPYKPIEELVGAGNAQFEYAQREPIAGIELSVT
jgi:hypothetical protein